MEFIDQLKPFIDWIHLHPHWAGLITFFIAMSESLPVIGLIIPGSVIMSAVGTLVGARIIPAAPTIIWAIIGAFAGDIVSYHLGSLFNERIPRMWPFRRYPHWLTKAQDFFTRHGGKSVFLGRFIGPMRPITPTVAGMMQLPIPRFYTASFIASSLWAPIYMLPGILIGAASQELAPATATRFLITVVSVLIVLWLTTWLFKWLLGLLFRLIGYWVKRSWDGLRHTKFTAPFCHWLQDPANPESHSQLILLLSWLIVGGIGIWCGWETLQQGILTHLDHPVHQLFLNLHNNLATRFFICLTLLSSKSVLIPAMLMGFLWLIWHKQWQIAWHWLLGPILIMGVVGLSDVLVYTPHPSGLTQIFTGNSFPSSQAAFTIAIYGFLTVLITRPITIQLRRQVIYYTAITLITLIVFSRQYLGLHWMTDMIGGIVCGVWVLLIVTLSLRRHPIYRLASSKFLAVFFVMIALGWGLQMLQNYRDFIENFTPFWPSYQATLANWWQESPSLPPLYRSNRVGKPVQIMNVQWLDNLNTIQKTLTAHGWVIQRKLGVISAINSLSSNDKQKKLPILQPLYLGQKPILIALKQAPGLNQFMRLQLWSSKLTFTDSNLPLWVGTIEYQIPHPRIFWQQHRYQQKYANLPSPINELMPLNQQYQIKLVYYPLEHRPPTIPEYEWAGGALFIKPFPQRPATVKKHHSKH